MTTEIQACPAQTPPPRLILNFGVQRAPAPASASASAPGTDPEAAELEDVRRLFRRVGDACRAAVQGRDDVIALLLTGLFADGHVLLEDHPGSGKSTLANALGRTIAREGGDAAVSGFRRIQFTPDLLPSDITGGAMFDAESKTFVFRAGPVFANVVLADEINRTSPKVQAALLEAMAEKQVTVDNQTHRLEEVFFVLATQNPLDLAGTYPLPRAQLDRFLFKIRMSRLSRAQVIEVLARQDGARARRPEVAVGPSDIAAARRRVREAVHVPGSIHECLADAMDALWNDRRVVLGISPRSLVQAIPALQVWAMTRGRSYVSPVDVKSLAVALFAHRLELAPGAEDAETVVTQCLAPVIEAATRKTLAPKR